MIHLAAAAGRTVLIGDHCQLPPIVTQPARTTRIAEASELRSHGFSDLRLTLFERLWRRCESKGWKFAVGMLEEHFRMHEDVAALVNEIRNALDAELLSHVTVDTVERFQSMERDFIVVSLAVGNRFQVERMQSLTVEEDGRMPVDRKLNVALSRARSHVVVLGHEPVLRTVPQYVCLIDRIRAQGGYAETPGAHLFESS